MGLETGNYVADLVETNPVGADDKKYHGDDHIRLVKSVLKNTFPGFAGRISRVQSKGVDYTVIAADNHTMFDCSAGLTLNYTAASSLGNGHLTYVHARGGDVVIDPSGTEQINGRSTLTVHQGTIAVVFCDGTGFHAAIAPKVLTAFALVEPGVRLTLASGIPVTHSDITGATVVYCTPYKSNAISLYNGSAWIRHTFSELSQSTTDATKSPAAVAANSLYDVFVWNDSGTLRATRGPAWSSSTSRGTGAGTAEVELFEGRVVNKHAITNGPAARRGLYVGTIESDGSAQINDSYARRNVYNFYNQERRPLFAQIPTGSWTYDSTTVRPSNGNTTYGQGRVGFTLGLHQFVNVSVEQLVDNGASSVGQTNIGLDSTTTPSASLISASTVSVRAFNVARYVSVPVSPGSHYFQSLENTSAAATSTFYGQPYHALYGEIWG